MKNNRDFFFLINYGVIGETRHHPHANILCKLFQNTSLHLFQRLSCSFFLLFSHAGFYRPENRENSCSRARVENWQWNINKTFRKIVRDITHAHSTSKRHIVIWASFFYVPSNLWRCSSRARDQNKKEKLKTKKREEKNEKRI